MNRITFVSQALALAVLLFVGSFSTAWAQLPAQIQVIPRTGEPYEPLIGYGVHAVSGNSETIRYPENITVISKGAAYGTRGKDPMAHADAWAGTSGAIFPPYYSGEGGHGTVLIRWPNKFSRFDNQPVDTSENFPVRVNYRIWMKVSAKGDNADVSTMGRVWILGPSMIPLAQIERKLVISDAGSPSLTLKGTLSFSVPGNQVGMLMMWVEAQAFSFVVGLHFVDDPLTPHFEAQPSAALAQVIVDPFLYIDPQWVHAAEYQVLILDSLGSSNYVPAVETPIDFTPGDTDLVIPDSGSVAIAALPLTSCKYSVVVGNKLLKYDLPRESDVTVKIYNLKGRLLSSAITRRQSAGSHSLRLTTGSLCSGNYILVFDADIYKVQESFSVMR